MPDCTTLEVTSEPVLDRRVLLGLIGCLGANLLVPHSPAFGSAANGLRIQSPQPFEVVQRSGFEPSQAWENVPGGPKLGNATVLLRGESSVAGAAKWESRWFAAHSPMPPPDAEPSSQPKPSDAPWVPLDVQQTGSDFSAKLVVPAGGWYRLELRAIGTAGEVLAWQSVEPLGVGEVFLIAGQSYAAGANDELLKVTDPRQRVAAFDVATNQWRIAHDPQPNQGDGGTIWPAFADLLVSILNVPVGLVNVAVGGTSSRQWLPGEHLYEQLRVAGSTTKSFRFVLWQQGESDVIEGVDTARYVRNLTAIRSGLSQAWGAAPPWLLAKSTLHPTVYRKPAEELRIRHAIDELYRQDGFLAGPDTDILGGENRGGPKTRRHFSGIGQRRAGLLWFNAVWNALNREPKT